MLRQDVPTLAPQKLLQTMASRMVQSPGFAWSIVAKANLRSNLGSGKPCGKLSHTIIYKQQKPHQIPDSTKLPKAEEHVVNTIPKKTSCKLYILF